MWAYRRALPKFQQAVRHLGVGSNLQNLVVDIDDADLRSYYADKFISLLQGLRVSGQITLKVSKLNAGYTRDWRLDETGSLKVVRDRVLSVINGKQTFACAYEVQRPSS